MLNIEIIEVIQIFFAGHEMVIATNLMLIDCSTGNHYVP